MEPTSVPDPIPAQFADENKRAEDLIDAGDLSGAARILVDIVGKDARNFRAFNNMGIVAWMQHAWEDAYTMFKTSVTLMPDYADALVNLFDASLKLRRVADVAPLFEKAAALDPADEDITAIADNIRQQGDGIYQTQRALAIGVHNPRIDEANKLLTDGELFKAMEIYLDINDHEGPSSEAFSGLGVISYYQKRYEDAYTLFVESIKLNPFDPDKFLNLLDAAKECSRIKEAREVYQAYLPDVPALQAIAEEFEQAQP